MSIGCKSNRDFPLRFFLTVLLVSSGMGWTPSTLAAGTDLCAAYNSVRPAIAIRSVRNGSWSDPGTWGGQVPTAADDVSVDHQVTLDQGSGREIQVNGQLLVNGTLNAFASILVCDGGVLSGSQGAIQFYVDDDRNFTGNTQPGPVAGSFGFHPEDNGIWVVAGGTLDLAAPAVTSWLDAVSINGQFQGLDHDVSTSVAFANGSGRLAAQPQGWKTGDQLLLVSERGEHTLATLTGINGTSISYQAETNLVGRELRIDNQTLNPKIANLTRRFQIVGALVTENDTNHRPHTAYLMGSNISIKNVEFRNLGPRAKLGRYPVHWHHAHANNGILHGSSIWQSVDEGGNRFVVPHIVNGVTVSDNVGFRAHGHGYFMEEVNEYDNVITGNLSVDVRYGEELANVNDGISGRTHHFWLRESNQISGNVAAGNNWDGKGKGNKTPGIEGLVVLPSTKKDAAPLVSDFECLGCGGTGMWSAGPNTLFEDPKSAYAIVSGYQAWDRWNTDSRGSELLRPLFLFNGNNDLFKATGDWGDWVPWASQLYVNYGEILISDGILAGDIGIHAHYGARFSIDGGSVHGNILLDQTYWELVANISNVEVYTDTLVSKGYGHDHRISPGFARLENLCFFSECSDSTVGGFSAIITGRQFTPLLDPVVNLIDDPALKYVAFSQSLPTSGYVRIPKGLGAKYWAIAPAGSGDYTSILAIQERESKWERNLGLYGGYLDGLPPGNYDVRLYAGNSEDTFVAAGSVAVYEGLKHDICLDGQACAAEDSPTVVISSPLVNTYNSGDPVYFSGFANDLSDGQLTSQILWTSSLDGVLGNGSGFQRQLSDGYHTIQASVSDSEGNQGVAEITVKVGVVSAPTSSGGTSGSTPIPQITLASGVAVYFATKTCGNGLDPHWQCGGSWTSIDAIQADTWVAYCSLGESTYSECFGADAYKRFGDLDLNDAIGACVGVALEGGFRNDCENAKGPDGRGSHQYVLIADLLATGDTGSEQGAGAEVNDGRTLPDDNIDGSAGGDDGTQDPTEADTTTDPTDDSATQGDGDSGSSSSEGTVEPTGTGSDSGTDSTDSGGEPADGSTATEDETVEGDQDPAAGTGDPTDNPDNPESADGTDSSAESGGEDTSGDTESHSGSTDDSTEGDSTASTSPETGSDSADGGDGEQSGGNAGENTGGNSEDSTDATDSATPSVTGVTVTGSGSQSTPDDTASADDDAGADADAGDTTTGVLVSGGAPGGSTGSSTTGEDSTADSGESTDEPSEGSTSTGSGDSGSSAANVIPSGAVVFNSKTLSDVDNNGTIIGGTLAGTIDNRDGTLVNVTLAADAVVTGGRLSGTLAGSGQVNDVLLDISAIDGDVQIGYGTSVTQAMLNEAAIAGMELTGAVRLGSSRLDASQQLIHSGNAEKFTIADLVKQGINEYLGQKSTTIRVLNETGILQVDHDFLEASAQIKPISVYATSMSNGVEILSTGVIRIVRKGLAIYLIDVTVTN